MSVLVHFGSVNKGFRQKGQTVQAVRNLGFQVLQGEAIGFVGQNGAGKSTSMKMLMGMLKPDSGDVQLMGLPAWDERARQGVGYVPENPYLYDYLTPLETLVMGLAMHRRATGKEAHDIAMGWLDRLGIAYAAHKRVRNLSKGMTQRTALAHALAIEPQLLVLDEPMSGLDPVGRKLVADEVQSYRSRGGTVFFCSHILNDVERLASRILLLHQGELKANLSMSELLTQGDMVVRYHGTALDGFVAEGTDIWKRQVPKAQVQQALETIQSAGAELIDVQRAFTLEALFDRVVRGDSGSDR
jgi:ABC-2 type transport system ATP-binding protein